MYRVGILFILLFTGLSKVFAQSPACAGLTGSVSADSIRVWMEVLTGKRPFMNNGMPDTIKSRYLFHPGNLAAASYISQTCTRLGYQVSVQSYSTTGNNIIATRPGSVFPDKIVLLCAHYDCVGSPYTSFQGADDNASGVAALLEAARLFRETDFPCTVKLAFWDEEEAGLLGSKAFVQRQGSDKYVCILNMDMIGWDNDLDSLAMIHALASLPATVKLAKMADTICRDYRIHLQPYIKEPGELNTDHQSFWDSGLPAIGLTEDYERDFNPNWHRYSDSIENINSSYLTEMIKFSTAISCDLNFKSGVSGVLNSDKTELPDVYPNPVQSKFHIPEWNGFKFSDIRFYSLDGRELELIPGDNSTWEIPDSVSSGLYLLYLKWPSGIVLKKILVNRAQ